MLLRSSYLKIKNNVFSSGSVISLPYNNALTLFTRTFSDDKFHNDYDQEIINSTIIVENGFNLQELPVVVRKIKDIVEINEKPDIETNASAHDSVNYHLIQTEFKQCMDLRDVFSLLSKCTKITPNIALGAMERIYDLEKDPNLIYIDSKNIHVNLAKGAIMDKLLKVVMKTEDTQTILNVLKAVSSFMAPYKYKYCDELLFRVTDNKLSINHLCEFANFLIDNKGDPKYSEAIDKLWVGFIGREGDINETNIVQIFSILPSLKISKKTILTLLEQKLFDHWYKIKVCGMQNILSVFVHEKYFSIQSFSVIGRWFNTNIHALNEDAFLDVISKITRLKYTDEQVEKAVEKYMKLKSPKITSYIIVVGILNYCMEFHVYNNVILSACSEYFVKNANTVPPSFLKAFIYPFGYLNFEPASSLQLWSLAEDIICERFYKMSTGDICSIILSFLYLGKHPLTLVKKLFSSEYLVKINNSEVMKKLNLIDTALSLECPDYAGPLLPKDQWSKSITQDHRIQNIINKMKCSFVDVAGGEENMSTAVLVPNLCSDETYLIDVMLHPSGLGSKTFNWIQKSARNVNIAILIHLPDHYCSDNEHLIGLQVMRKRHLKLLGLKVVSLKYSVLSQYYTSYNIKGLKQYLMDGINNAEPCK